MNGNFTNKVLVKTEFFSEPSKIFFLHIANPYTSWKAYLWQSTIFLQKATDFYSKLLKFTFSRQTCHNNSAAVSSNQTTHSRK